MDRRDFLTTAGLGALALSAGRGRAQEPERKRPCIIFTKHLKELSIAQLVEALKSAGADGADLCVRPGYPVNPENAPEALPGAAEAFRAAGLSVPLVTAPTDLTEASVPYVEGLFRACAEAGVPLLKLGYWPAPTEGYWGAVESMRADVAAFAELGARYHVKPCLHTHSGANLGLNAAALMHVLRSFSPQEVGAYLDVGHLAVCGEPPALAFAMAAEWLAVIGIKDMDRVKEGTGTKTRTVRMGEGFVNWPEVVAWLVQHDFGGPLTFHCEFPAAGTEDLLRQAEREIGHVRGLAEEARAELRG
jgi:sugar phosphate isomerase/epimerase